MLAEGRLLMKDYNVTMEEFVLDVDFYVEDIQLLVKILFLQECKVQKDVCRLHRKGIYTLAFWKEFRHLKEFNIWSNSKERLTAAVNAADSAEVEIQVSHE
ncbi:hypothetical protein Tc00.1047053506051.20 [Trypanosoma cruzi]|uniref:DUF7578 domain-containing protein n=1 Tax=Trypanosoma cruzi (strain CL Brener) TaxID=353153 RepID=Q4CSU5_TRYCC|nr:uncharacterized protein Tc00.1047053506051.20 [Trypanosoma cruzi]EAN83346.1 hypothetical protein Tc00.1047053506051.20 [Trypanosoma cruzi]|eukprot:XP_805197.1 hypothetical protein Tc00.1047053506051.20 [Trypanosoma cruzi strain CL Brener]